MKLTIDYMTAVKLLQISQPKKTIKGLSELEDNLTLMIDEITTDIEKGAI